MIETKKRWALAAGVAWALLAWPRAGYAPGYPECPNCAIDAGASDGSPLDGSAPDGSPPDGRVADGGPSTGADSGAEASSDTGELPDGGGCRTTGGAHVAVLASLLGAAALTRKRRRRPLGGAT
jgi:MYXO-CTERM domain-containing protein